MEEEDDDNNGGQQENLRESGGKDGENYQNRVMELSNVHTMLMSQIARAGQAILWN